MANVIINDAHLTDIADAIRNKKSVSTTYLPSEMADAISSISTSGGEVIYENGWQAATGYYAMEPDNKIVINADIDLNTIQEFKLLFSMRTDTSTNTYIYRMEKNSSGITFTKLTYETTSFSFREQSNWNTTSAKKYSNLFTAEKCNNGSNFDDCFVDYVIENNTITFPLITDEKFFQGSMAVVMIYR